MAKERAMKDFGKWVLFPAAVMSLGWGLRGYIGGGPLGAMIPGSLTALALALLLRLDNSRTLLLAAWGAVGMGFGGEETYGQTVGLSLQEATYGWALIGFAVKGSVWGFLGAAFLGIALSWQKYSTRQWTVGMGLFMVSGYLGWIGVNKPKWIYFSNLLDHPRDEVWAALWIAGLVLSGWLWLCARNNVPWLWAWIGALGGGVGFPLGAAAQVYGRGIETITWLDWWKVMEFTFGACLGAAIGLASHLAGPDRDGKEKEEEGASSGIPWKGICIAAFVLLLLQSAKAYMPLRIGFMVTGALLLTAAAWEKRFHRHIAVTAVCFAFLLDWVRNAPPGMRLGLWTLAVVGTLGIAWWMEKTPQPRSSFYLLLWSAVAVSVGKSLSGTLSLPHALVELVFLTLASGCTWYVHYRIPSHSDAE